MIEIAVKTAEGESEEEFLLRLLSELKGGDRRIAMHFFRTG